MKTKMTLAQVKACYEALKAIQANNLIPFELQWKFKKVVQILEPDYLAIGEEIKKLQSIKDQGKITEGLNKLSTVEVELTFNPININDCMVKTNSNLEKDLIINGPQMDVLMEAEILFFPEEVTPEKKVEKKAEEVVEKVI